MLFRRRPDDDTKLKGFWELPEKEQLPNATIGAELGRFKHSITNFNNTFTIYSAQIPAKPTGYAWLTVDKPVEYLFKYDGSQSTTIDHEPITGFFIMQRTSLLAFKAITILAVMPLLVLAKATGPDPRMTGAPGDDICTSCQPAQ